MSKQDSEPTKEELEQRVNQLEQTVQKMMPNRRQAIKGLGLLGGGALLGGVGSQEAEAATGSAGSVGTSSDRPDVFADTVDSNSLSTEQITNGGIIEIQKENLGSGQKTVLNEKADLFSGFVFITAESGDSGGYAVDESESDVTKLFASSPDRYDTVEGASSSVNVYYDSGNNRFELENGFGGSNDFTRTIIRL